MQTNNQQPATIYAVLLWDWKDTNSAHHDTAKWQDDGEFAPFQLAVEA